MKNIFIASFLLFSVSFQGQTLQDKINDLTTKIAKDLNSKKPLEIAVYPFSYLKPNEQNLAFDVRFDVHEQLKKKGTSYSVMDRGTFDTYANEHRLNSEGLIDEATAKKFGKLIAADAYVTGKVYMFGSVIRIRLKVTNTETGEILSMQSEKLPVDYDMAQFLGIKNWEERREKAEENKSQNPNCAIENVGDYCFLNNTNSIYEIHLKKDVGGGFSSTYARLVISPNMKSCFKDLKSGSYSYEMKRRVGMVGPATKYRTEFKGDFTIKKCESRLQKIGVKNYKLNNINIGLTNKEKLFLIEIINPNYYARKLTFTNENNQRELVTVGSSSRTSIKLPKGFYRFTSKTTFSNSIVQQSNFTLNSNKSISLNKDHKN